jgi:hypothetical protein
VAHVVEIVYVLNTELSYKIKLINNIATMPRSSK